LESRSSLTDIANMLLRPANEYEIRASTIRLYHYEVAYPKTKIATRPNLAAQQLVMLGGNLPEAFGGARAYCQRKDCCQPIQASVKSSTLPISALRVR
jgi:hypothetical protein